MKRTLGVGLAALCAALVLAPPAWGGNQETYAQLTALGAQIDAAKANPEQADAVAQLLEQYSSLAASLGGDDPAGLLDGAGSASLNGPPVFVAPPAPPNGSTTTATFSNNTPVPILDNATASSTISVTTGDTYIWDLDLTVDITHTFAADLDITLTSPNGTVIVVTTDNGGGNDDVFSGTTFDDSAMDTVTDHVYTNLVTATPLIPEGPFGGFIGEDPNGIWTLSIGDDAGGDTGTLNSWSLDVTTVPQAPIDDPVVSGTNNTPVPILDNATAISTATVAGAQAFLCDVNLTVAITHTFAADLDITLTSPSGTITTVTTDNGGGNDDVFNGTTFDDSAPDTVTDFVYTNLVTATPLQPEGAMAAFIGEDPNGIWTLSIGDDAGGDTGSLNSWSVDVTTCAGFLPPNDPVVTIPTLNTVGLAVLLFLLVAAAFWAMRRRTA